MQKDRFKGGERQGGQEEEPDEHSEEDRHEDEEEKGWHMVHHGKRDEIVHAETRDSEKESQDQLDWRDADLIELD